MKENFVVLELGERRKLPVQFWLDGETAFTTKDPTWELYKTAGSTETLHSSGPASADVGTDNRWTLTALIEPDAEGEWKLTYSFGFGEEKIRRSFRIKVV